MHASLDKAKYFLGQNGTMGRVQGYITTSYLLAIAKLRYMHGADVAKIG